jgi:GTP pyrophosphokinase
MTWLRKLLDSQEELKSAKEFLENLKVDLFVGEVFVFTPKGEVFDFPQGATTVDFAYRVHTEVGHRCAGAKVNGRIVPLDYKLQNGDIVEIIAGKFDNPSLDWINFIATPSAKNKIKSWFKKRKKEENVKRGREKVGEEMKKMFLEPSAEETEELFGKIAAEMSFTNPAELFAAVGYGEISAYQIARKLRDRLRKVCEVPRVGEEIIQPLLVKKTKRKKKSQGVQVAKQKDVWVNFSRCCKPLPGDKIVGYITKNRGISVHRADCANVVSKSGKNNRLVEVSWDTQADVLYPISIEVEAFDRVGVFKDILEKIAGLKTNVASANVRTKRGSSAILKLVVDVKNIEHLSQVLQIIRSVSDVYDVYRSDVKML